MGQWEEYLEKIRNNPRNARFDDILNLLRHYGFHIRPGKGSHYVASRGRYRIVIVRENPVKIPYVRQCINAIDAVTEEDSDE